MANLAISVTDSFTLSIAAMFLRYELLNKFMVKVFYIDSGTLKVN